MKRKLLAQVLENCSLFFLASLVDERRYLIREASFRWPSGRFRFELFYVLTVDEQPSSDLHRW